MIPGESVQFVWKAHYIIIIIIDIIDWQMRLDRQSHYHYSRQEIRGHLAACYFEPSHISKAKRSFLSDLSYDNILDLLQCPAPVRRAVTGIVWIVYWQFEKASPRCDWQKSCVSRWTAGLYPTRCSESEAPFMAHSAGWWYPGIGHPVRCLWQWWSCLILVSQATFSVYTSSYWDRMETCWVWATFPVTPFMICPFILNALSYQHSARRWGGL